MSPRSCGLALLALLLPLAGVRAQIFVVEPSRASSAGTGWGLDVALHVAQPVRDFARNVDVAVGIGSSVSHRFRAFPVLALRGDIGFLNYGNERQRVPLSSTVNRVFVEMNTSNNIFHVSGGPELGVRRGPVRPYLHGFAGYSYFYTESSAGDDDGGSAFARSTHHADGGLAVGGGGGVRVPIRARVTEIGVDAGARYTRNGVRSYLRSGDILDLSDGSLSFTPRVTRADYWIYYLGASFTFGRRR